MAGSPRGLLSVFYGSIVSTIYASKMQRVIALVDREPLYQTTNRRSGLHCIVAYRVEAVLLASLDARYGLHVPNANRKIALIPAWSTERTSLDGLPDPRRKRPFRHTTSSWLRRLLWTPATRLHPS